MVRGTTRRADGDPTLTARRTFSAGTYRSDGCPWFEWHQLPKDAATCRSSIAFAFVATHNHFVLDRSGKVFNRFGAGHQAAGGRKRGRPLLDGVLLDEAG